MTGNQRPGDPPNPLPTRSVVIRQRGFGGAHMRRYDPEKLGYLPVPAAIDARLDRADPSATGRALAAGGYDVQWRYMRWNADAARAISAPIDAPPADTQIFSIAPAPPRDDRLDDDSRSILVTVTPTDDATGVGTTVRPGRLRTQPDP